MKIIFKDNIENYRYAVGKATFLAHNPDYVLIKNYPFSNCMAVREGKSGSEKLISIFGQPTIKTEKTGITDIIVVSQREPLLSVKQKYQCIIADDELKKLFNKNLNEALHSPNTYFNRLDDETYAGLFSEIMIDPNNLQKHQLEFETLNKYYRIDRVEKSRDRELDGYVSFYNPTSFNDPFDCKCVFANDGKNASGNFRVLCTVPEHDNILMWAYYAEDHKGYCLEYSFDSILKAIDECPLNGLCFIGHVDYKDKRPAYKIPQNVSSFSDIKFYVDATFTKYKRWEHENEYRFVIVSQSFEQAGGNADGPDSFTHVTLKAKLEKTYRGCKAVSAKDLENSNKETVKVTQLHEDSTDYKLI